jgi:hypothetical protein
METETEGLELWKNDPLIYRLKERLHVSDTKITLGLTGIAAIVFFGLGWIANRSYTGTGIRFEDTQYLYFELVRVFVLIPLSIGFYVWQPGAFMNLFENLERMGVIQRISEKGRKYAKSYPDFLRKFRAAVDNRIWTLVAVVCVLGAWVLTYRFVIPPPFSSIDFAFWHNVKWFLAVWSLVVSLWLYVLFMVLLKGWQGIWYLNCLFKWFNIRVFPMHPDEAGGLRILGNFALRTSSFAVGIGVAAAALSIIEWMGGGNPLARMDTVVFWIIYVLCAPASLILPMLSAHRAMQEARYDKLNEISREFENTLSATSLTKVKDTEAIKEANEKLQELRTRYSIVAESFPTWPVPARLFRNFSITATLPMVSGLVSMIIGFTRQQ